MDTTELIQTVLIYALPVLFAITLHEAAHGYAARRFGDMTATVMGRVTLNPLAHIGIQLLDAAGKCGVDALRDRFIPDDVRR